MVAKQVLAFPLLDLLHRFELHLDALKPMLPQSKVTKIKIIMMILIILSNNLSVEDGLAIIVVRRSRRICPLDIFYPNVEHQLSSPALDVPASVAIFVYFFSHILSGFFIGFVNLMVDIAVAHIESLDRNIVSISLQVGYIGKSLR